ncbi:hypothetical protein M758_7G081300 [Ceratodon purpureus]|nr:hypothetical protein M758_7G081300 [Ceratodon purpureus]
MSDTMKILEPKGYEPSFHKKNLSRPEDGFYSRSNSLLKGYDDMLMQENDDDYEEYNTKEVLEEALFRNIPEITPRTVIPSRHRENCIAQLQEIEKELEQFSENFGSQLHNLRMSMRESFSSMPDSRTSRGSSLEISAPSDEDMNFGYLTSHMA